MIENKRQQHNIIFLVVRILQLDPSTTQSLYIIKKSLQLQINQIELSNINLANYIFSSF